MVGEKVNSRGYREARPARENRPKTGSAYHQANAAIHALAEEICQYAARCVAETDCGPDTVEVAHIIWRHMRGDEE
jgi:hypothetical protein